MADVDVSILVVVETNYPVGLALDFGTDFTYLLELAENHPVSFALPEFCNYEAKPVLRRWSSAIPQKFDEMRGFLRNVRRSRFLQPPIEQMLFLFSEIENLVSTYEHFGTTVLGRFLEQCQIIPHLPDAHIRGRLRHIGELPPFKETDCEIFECILEFLRNDVTQYTHKIFLTLDRNDFDHDHIHNELEATQTQAAFAVGECIALVREFLNLSE